MITIQNIQGVNIEVSSLRVLDGKIASYFDYAEPTLKWCEGMKDILIRTDETIQDPKHENKECRVFALVDGCMLVKNASKKKGEKKADKKKADKGVEKKVEVEAVESAPEPSVEAVEPENIPTPEPEKKAEKKSEKKVDAQPEASGLNDALAAAFAPVFANVAKQIEQNIRAEVQAEIDELKAQAKTHVQRIELVREEGKKVEMDGLFCEEFEDMVEDVNAGWYPYLWGAAGCGKSHTCQQIAEALGLPYYTQNMLNFAHEITGYGDAGGNFVETAFFKAFSGGGIFHLDEADRSQIEGLVALNQALEQGVMNFPVIGNVRAHKDFRFICSGNTQMNGADEMYTSGQQQDASFKRRVVFYEMHYDRRIELPIMAQGDEVLVNFVEDVRRAIKRTGTLHFVSYTETRYLKQHENKKEKALIRSAFKSLDMDIIRQIYAELQDKNNVWAVAMNNVITSAEL